MAGRSAERRERVTRGTGNVLADLRFPDALDRRAKLHRAYALNQVLDGRKLSQADAAKSAGNRKQSATFDAIAKLRIEEAPTGARAQSRVRAASLVPRRGRFRMLPHRVTSSRTRRSDPESR